MHRKSKNRADRLMKYEICSRFDRLVSFFNNHRYLKDLNVFNIDALEERDIHDNIKHLETMIMKTIQINNRVQQFHPLRRKRPDNRAHTIFSMMNKNSTIKRKSLNVVKATTTTSIDESVRYNNDISDSENTSVDSEVGSTDE